MKPFLDKEKFFSLTHSLDNYFKQSIYHHPNTGRLGGWVFSLLLNGETVVLGGLGIIENIALGALNLVSIAFSEEAKKDFKANLSNIKSLGFAVLLSPLGMIFTAVDYHGQPQEDDNLRLKESWQPIHFAAAYNDVTLLAKLIEEENVDPNLETEWNNGYNTTYHQTPLHIATSRCNIESLKILMKNGADCLLQNTYKQTPLEDAILHDNISAIKVLLEAGDVNVVRAYDQTVLHCAVSNQFYAQQFGTMTYKRSLYKEIIELLVQNGADVNKANKQGETPLMRAARDNQVEAIQALMEAGAHINTPDANQQTAIHYAITAGQLEALQALLSYPQLDVNKQDSAGCTILHYAAYKVNSRYIEEIIKRPDLNPNLQSHDGRTALHYAVQKNVIKHDTKQNVEVLMYLPSLDPYIKDHTNRKANDYTSDSDYTFVPPMTLKEKIERDIFGPGYDYLKGI